MKIAISNIGWNSNDDSRMYKFMKENGVDGLEIAPTKIIPIAPYDNLDLAREFADEMRNQGIIIPSMQSIWYGKNEEIFGSEEERKALIEYTKKAVIFAETIGCENLVFGCPRNRNINDADVDYATAITFFKELGDFAAEHHTTIGMEANPEIYNTNFVNTTSDALKLIEDVDSEGFKLNLDIGTMVYNQEDCELLRGKVTLINHVHLSEPYLRQIEKRVLHKELRQLLEEEGYSRYVSAEMGTQEKVEKCFEAMIYLKEVFDYVS